MLKGKTILLGVSGGIAAYKIPNLASMLKKQGADVRVIMTENAVNFINPIAFETLTGHKCLTDTFDRNFEFQVGHVSLAKQVDLAMVAPASANIIGKIAHGICDDMLTTTLFACQCPKLIVPAMNTRMYENPILQDNLELCRKYGMQVIDPAAGYLACGDSGAGKMSEPEELFDFICQAIEYPRDMTGIRVLVTAGPTAEAIDPVRFITNHSTGTMGYALAKAAARRGATVTLVTGPTALARPRFMEIIEITSAKEMFEAVKAVSPAQDMMIKAAAVADYRPVRVAGEKVKKKDGQLDLALERTEDILAWLGANRRPGQYLCGFSMETENMLENSREKLKKKQADMIVANNLKVAGAGFGTGTNVVTIITETAEIPLEKMSKEQAAHEIINAILKCWRKDPCQI